MYKKYELNENYFNMIDSHEKAYILGFIYADGYNREDLLELVQIKSRLDILLKIRKALGSTHPIKEYTTDKYTLNIGSVKLCKDLTNLGAFRNKSLFLTFPNTLDPQYMCSFILGYFDGDGCVWDGKRKIMQVKDTTKPDGYRNRIIHNVKFTITGNFTFINSLQDFLVAKLGFKKTKLNFSKAKDLNNNTSDSICTMEYSGRGQLAKLYNYMYKYSPIWCDEKKLKFENIFCALEEKSSKDTSLIAGTPETVISSQDDNISEGSSTIPEMGVEASASKCEAPNSKAEGEEIVSSAIK